MDKEIELIADDRYYRSDSMVGGRKAKEFLRVLSENIFNKSYGYYKKGKELKIGAKEYAVLPIFHNESTANAVFAASIDEITPLYWSELGFITDENRKRRLDFWCQTGVETSYLIELKSDDYTYDISRDNLTESSKQPLNDLLWQIEDVKKHQPNIYNNAVIVGALIGVGWQKMNKPNPPENTEKDYVDKVWELIKNSGYQLYAACWRLPEDIKDERRKINMEHHIEWVTISYLVHSPANK